MDCKDNSCSFMKNEKKSDLLSLGSWVLIALLPKCPLCLFSYSAAISLCSGKTILKEAVGWTSYIPIVLAIILIGSFLYNYKGMKTLKAIGLALVGCIIILYGEYFVKNMSTYYIGAVTLLWACWMNGSFNFFVRKVKRSFLINKQKQIDIF